MICSVATAASNTTAGYLVVVSLFDQLRSTKHKNMQGERLLACLTSPERASADGRPQEALQTATASGQAGTLPTEKNRRNWCGWSQILSNVLVSTAWQVPLVDASMSDLRGVTWRFVAQTRQ